MVFNSLQYVTFLPLVLVLYWRLSRRPQNVLLLDQFLPVLRHVELAVRGSLIMSTVSDFTVGRALERTQDDGRRRSLFLISVFVNLPILALLAQVLQLLRQLASDLLERIGFQANEPTLAAT